MAESTAARHHYDYASITAVLKQVFRRRKVTYRELGSRLGLSESGVKKIMTASDGSLGRIAELCEAAAVDLFAVLELAWKAPPEPFCFTDAQDEFIAANLDFFRFFQALIHANLDPDAVRREHELDDRSVRHYLSGLDEFGFIELLPRERIRLGPGVTKRIRVGPKTRSRLGVDVHKTFLEFVHRRAENGENEPGQQLVVAANLRMTKERFAELNQALHEVVLRFGTDAGADELVTPSDKLLEVGLLVNTAPCKMSQFFRIQSIT